MNNNDINGVSGQAGNPLDTCACEVHAAYYSDGGVDVDIDHFIACEQCRNMAAEDYIRGAGGHPEAVVDAYSDMQDIEYGHFHAQTVFHGPLQKHQTDNRPRIAWVKPEEINGPIQSTILPDDLPF